MGRAPHAALAYATARLAIETDAIARPHLTTTPFAVTRWETTKRALSSFLRQYAFT